MTREAFIRRPAGSLDSDSALVQTAARTRVRCRPPPASFRPSVWLCVNPDGTATVTLNRTELGQGVTTGCRRSLRRNSTCRSTACRYSFAPAEPGISIPTERWAPAAAIASLHRTCGFVRWRDCTGDAGCRRRRSLERPTRCLRYARRRGFASAVGPYRRVRHVHRPRGEDPGAVHVPLKTATHSLP